METIHVEPDGFFSPSFILAHDGNPSYEISDPSAKEQSPYNVLKRLSKKWMKPLCLNLEGWRKFSEDKHEEALGLFQQAAAADETNTNALRHCRVVYRKLKRLEEVEEMSGQIEAISTGELAQVSKARSIAEVAVAGIVQQSTYGSTRSQMLQHAITIAENNIGKGDENAIATAAQCGLNGVEIAFWKLALVKATIINASGVNANIQNDDEKNNTQLKGNIHAELACGDFAEITAYALAQIGLMLKREGSKEYEIMKKVIQEQQVLGGSLEQKDYFDAAYKLDPSSPSVCRCYTLYLCYNKEFPEAQAMMKKTFECLESNECYMGAQAASGELLLKLYETGKQKKQYGKKNYLVQAITNLRIAARDFVCRFNISQLARCYHLLLMRDSPHLNHNDMIHTLAYFEKAIELCGCNSNPQIHFHHSECLADFGYIRRAVETSKRAVENDDRHLSLTFFMYNLMKQFNKLYKEEEEKEEGLPDFILSEMTFWMLLMCNKYGYIEEGMKRTFKNLHNHSTSSEIRMYHNLRHLGHHNIADLFHKYIQGFSSSSQDHPIEYVAPPVLAFPHNQLNKVFDVLVLHSVTDRPWVYYSLLTKLEMVHELKCCLVGRDILKDGHDDLREVDREGDMFRVDAGIQIPTVQGRNLVPIMKPKKYASIHDIHEKHVTSISNNIDQAKQAAIDNSVCVMLVITENALNNSIWFRDYKPSALLQQIMASHCKILALCLDAESCRDDLFPEGNPVEVFDGSVLVPWEALVKHIKILCGDTEEDLSKFDVEAHLLKDISIDEDEDEDEYEDKHEDKYEDEDEDEYEY